MLNLACSKGYFHRPYWHKIFTFNCSDLTWNAFHIADSVHGTLNFTITSVLAYQCNDSQLILSTYVNRSFFKANSTWLVLVMNNDETLGIISY